MLTGTRKTRLGHLSRSLLALILVLACFTPVSSKAQTVSDEIIQELADQGYSVISTRYTWLRRIVVTASDGVFERELLISRGTGVVLHDKRHRIAAPTQKVRVRQDEDDQKRPPPRHAKPRPGNGAPRPPGSPPPPPPGDKPGDRSGQINK